MTWLLDTNACISYLNGRSANLRTRLDATDPAEIRVCSIVVAELYFGAAMSSHPAKTRAYQKLFLSRFPSLPFDDAACDAYADIRADLTRRGCLIGPNDMLIAAICRVNDVTLVTRNLNEFGRVSGLAIEDWET